MADRVVRVELTGGTADFSKKFQDAAVKATDVGKALGEVQHQIDKISAAKPAKELQVVANAVAQMGGAAKLSVGEFARASKEVERLAAAGAKVPEGLKGIASAVENVRKLEVATAAAEKRMAGLSKLGGDLSGLGTKLSAALTVPIIGVAGASLKFAADFDQAMTQSTAIMGPLDAAMRKTLGQTAKDVAATTTFSATEAAKAFYFLSSAGLTAAESVAALPVVARFAQAGLLDMAKATELLMDTQAALGLRTGDVAQDTLNLARVSDVLTLAAVKTNTSIQQIAESMTTKAATAAKIMGVSLEEAAATLGIYANQGIKGTLAGEKFDILLRELSKNALENGAAFKAAGVAVFDSRGKFAGVANIIEQLEKRFRGMSAAQKVAEVGQLGFRAESQAAILALVGQSDALRNLTKDLESAGGATKNIADNQMKSFSAQLGLMAKQLQLAGIELGTAFMPILLSFSETAVKPAIGLLSDFAKGFAELPAPMQATGLALGLVAAGVGPLLIVVGQALQGFVALKGAAAALAGPAGLAGLAATIAPLLAIGVGLVGGGALGIWLSDNFEGARKFYDFMSRVLLPGLDLLLAKMERGKGAFADLSHGDFAKKIGAVNAEAKQRQGESVSSIPVGPRLEGSTKKPAAEGGGGMPVDAKKATAEAEKYRKELERLAAEERRGAIEAAKRWEAEEKAVDKVNAAVKKHISDAQVSIFGTSKDAATEAAFEFGILQIAVEKTGKSIQTMSEGQLMAYEAQLVKLEKASRDDAEANDEIATSLGRVRAQLREAGDEFEKGTQQIVVATDKTAEWISALDEAAGALSQLGNTDLGNLIGQFSQVLKQAHAIRAQLAKGGPNGPGWSGMDTAGKFQTGAAVGGAAIGIAMDAYAGANTNVAKSTAKGALTGAAKGAMIGSIVPGIGTAVGAVVGGVIGGVAGFLGSKKKIKEMLKGYDDALIQQFGSLEKAKKAADKYGIALGKALDSKKPKEIQAAMEKLNKALEKRANLEQGLMTAQGNVETLQDLTKAIDNPLLKAAVQALATKVSDELAKAGLGFAATGPLRDSAEFGAAQNIAGAAAGTVAGLRQAGVVDQGVLDAAAGVASEVQKQAFDAAKAAGMDDAAATKVSLGAISPLLREQLNASIASGRKLDAKVQEQIDLAKANGIDILADPAIEAVGVQKDILAAIKGQGQRDLGTNLLDARDRFGGEKSNLQSYAKGIGYVPETGPKLLHRGERVVPANVNMSTMRSVSSLASPTAALRGGGGGSQAPITIAPVINVTGSPQMSPSEFQLRVERATSDGVRQGSAMLVSALDRRYKRL